MKLGTAVALGLMLCPAIMLVLISRIEPVRPVGPVHNINTGIDYNTISDAIDAPQTFGYHTIMVDSGIYQENIWLPLSKPGLKIIGQNQTTTIIDANGMGEVIWSGADNITVTGFTIRNAGTDGIYLDMYVNNNTFMGNTITANWDHGIYMEQNSANNVVVGNNITQNGHGIHLWYSSNNRVHHNNFIDNVFQVNVTGFGNLWDNGYPHGGNYWSDFSARYSSVVDEYHDENQNVPGSDQIWDSPYEIEVDNEDGYPLVEPWNTPKLPGDVNGDGTTNASDLTIIAPCYGYFRSDPEYSRAVDIDYDGIVDVKDLHIVGRHQGETYP